MKEIEEIIDAYEVAVKAGKKSALATVVQVDGSSYRRAGARMLITEDGMLTGAISGGCLEGDALRKALMVILRQTSLLVTYDTSDEEDAVMGLGLGCNGVIQVLIEPLDAQQQNNPIQLLKAIAGKRRNASVVTLFCLTDKKNQQPGTCLITTEAAKLYSSYIPLKELLTAEAANVLHNKQSSFRNYQYGDQLLTAFTEFIPPAVSLIIAGAGNDVKPLAAIAAIIGFTTTIIDGRPAYAKKERFPASCSVLLAKPEEVLEQVNIDDRTAVVLMTHNYNYDLSMLRLLVQQKIKYIGMLGPAKKLERMINELAAAGIGLSPEQRANIYSPVGLNIGAETAAEIALSVIAEIKSVFASATPVSLKENKDPIHQRPAFVGQSVKSVK